MSNLAHNISERPSETRLARPKAHSAPRAPNTPPGMPPHLVTREAELSRYEREDARASGIKLRPELRFSAPKLVATLPFVVVARVSERRWAVYFSNSETADVASLLAGHPTGLEWSKANAIRTARAESQRRSLVRPLMSQFAQLLASHGRSLPASVFGEWLRDRASELRARPHVVPGDMASLGQIATLVLQEGALR